MPVVARTEANVFQQPRIEAGEFRLHAVATGHQTTDGGRAVRARLHRRLRLFPRRLFKTGDGDRRRWQYGVALIDDGENQSGVARRLGQTYARGREKHHDHRGHRRDAMTHLWTSNFFGSIFALMRNRSNVVSSVVVAPSARRILNGSFSPSTSR